MRKEVNAFVITNEILQGRQEVVMSEEERLFLEIVDLKKGFGSGEARQ